MSRQSGWQLVVLVGLLGLMVGPTSLQAQYFGRNKVQYEQFDFEIMSTPHLSIYHYPEDRRAITDAARMSERWYTRLSTFLEHDFKFSQPLILYTNHADFQQTNVISGILGQGTGGVTEGLKNRVVLPLTGVYADNDHVIGHELVHAFQYDIVRSEGGSLGAMSRLPLWFIEGMAEYLSIGREHPLTAMWLRDAVLHDDVPTIEQMTFNPKYFPYRFGHALWAFIGGTWGDEAIPVIYRTVMKAGNLDAAFRRVLGDSLKSLSKKWNQAIHETYEPQVRARTKPSEVGEPVLTGHGGLNLAPAISPDGRHVAFISRRDLFTVDLFLADAKTGKIIKKLVSSNSDAHFDALRFIDSAGAWSPDGKRFAFVVFKNGDNSIAILDVASKDVKRTIRLKQVEAITNLAWSPDGRRIAFSGMQEGISDLYLYDLQSQEISQLTDDRHADLQPTWSPDGQTLAFVTDRGSATDFDRLVFGEMKLALMRPEAPEDMEQVFISEGVKHINPQFSPDGQSLYFVADPGGFSDVYRYHLDTGAFYQVTHVATGVSGITALAPCMTVARNTGRMMFSVFEKTNYNVYALDSEAAQGSRLSSGPPTNAALPPVTRATEGIVEGYLGDPLTGLPEDATFARTEYDPSLGLVAIGRTSLGVAVDRFGTAIGGAVSLLFSDMLGNRLLGTALQLNGGIKDLGAQAMYQNRRSRLNWGVAGGHIPFLTGFTAVGIDTLTVDGQQVPAQTVDFIEQRVFNETVSFLSEYPISTNRRLEATASFSHIHYDVEAERVFFVQGRPVASEDVDRQAPSPVNLLQGSVAYVGDYSFFGFTSPVNGRRFRFEVQPTVGTLEFVGFLADYRKYFFLKPATLAFRGLHFGRYFGDADSPRLTPLFLGFPTFVRGYEIQSFERGESAQFNRLVGSRIGVFNAEFRLPLFGTQQFGLVSAPMLPTELALFFDGGVAWTEAEAPEITFKRRSDERIPVFSAGAAARINLLGALVLQFYYAYPFQRPDAGWQFGFVLAPGW